MPAARRVTWAPAARRDLREAWRYYADMASPDIADGVLREIGRAADRVGGNPLAGRRRDELLPGLRSVLAHPYAIFYRVRNDDVEIARVLHERRDFSAALSKDQR